MPRSSASRLSAAHYVALALGVLAAMRGAAAQNATVCATDQLDWYTSVVGETPCRTYERLRQICDSRYEVGKFRTNTPGDNCDSQLHSCCCNSIAWNLSMLCMSCQNAGSAEADAPAIDAGKGAYGMYLAGCGVPTNGSLPTNIQTAVCTQQIDIRQTLYDAMWMGDGAWFYTYFRETMQTDFAAESGKNLSNCASAASTPSPTPSPTPFTNVGSATPPPTSSSSSSSSTSSTPTSSPAPAPQPNTLNVGAVAGGVAGGVGALLALLLAFYVWRRRRQGSTNWKHGEDAIAPGAPDAPAPVLQPFMASAADAGDTAAYAPPPYAEAPAAPRKGSLPASMLQSTSYLGSVSHAGSGPGSPPGASVYGSSSALGGSGGFASSGAGAVAGWSPIAGTGPSMGSNAGSAASASLAAGAAPQAGSSSERDSRWRLDEKRHLVLANAQ